MERKIKTVCLTSTALIAALIFANGNAVDAQNPKVISQTTKRVTPAFSNPALSNPASTNTVFSKQDPFEKQARENRSFQAAAQKPQINSAIRPAPLDPDEAMRRQATIEFNFQGVPWREVIDWFSEQAMYSMNYQVPAPAGSFTYKKNGKVTVNEGLDILNSQLELEQHSLIRNGESLILTNQQNGFPLGLVETISRNELDLRAKFEVVRCVFPGIPQTIATKIVQDVQGVIQPNLQHGASSVYSQAANKLYVQDKVGNLLRIRDLIDDAINLANEGFLKMETYRVKHIDTESLMFTVRQLMLFPPGESFALADQTLTVSIQPLGNRMFLKGMPNKITEFLKIAALVDVESTEPEEEFAKPFFKTYSVTAEPEMTFKIVNSFFDGEQGIKMDQDPESGNIYFLGNDEQHLRLGELLAKMPLDNNFKIIQVKYEDPDDIVDTIEELLGLDGEGAKGPTLVSNYENSYIMISGTPQELTKLESMIHELDLMEETDTGPRRNTVFLEMPNSEADRVMQMMQDGLYQRLGRPNVLNLIVPDERANIRKRLRTPQNFSQRDRFENQPERQSVPQTSPRGDMNRSDAIPQSNPAEKTPEEGSPFKAVPDTEQPAAGRSGKSTTHSVIRLRNSYIRIQDETPSPIQTGPTQAETRDVGDTSQETLDDNAYQPAPEAKSVPGAPVTIKQTESGIFINSDDLDVVEDLKYMIKDMVDMPGNEERPAVLYMQFRLVTEVKTLLESLLGMDGGGGGGGGGGIGGMMAGMVGNAVGGGVGDALGGLLGGGGGGMDVGGGGAIELDGDVTFTVDIRQNALYVLGATAGDLDILLELIDVIDRDSPPIDHRIGGKTFFIRLNYRDPEVVKVLVEAQFPGLLRSAAAPKAGANQQNAQQQVQREMAKAIQQLGGRGQQKSRGSSNPDQEKPTATLGVDVGTKSLIVTGPEHIYVVVRDFVYDLDQPGPPTKTLNVFQDGAPAPAVLEWLKTRFGDQIEITGEGENGNPAAGGAGGTTNRPRTGANTGTKKTSAPVPNMQNIRSMMQGMGRGGAGGGGRGAGGGSRGGGRGGAGGRGNRG